MSTFGKHLWLAALAVCLPLWAAAPASAQSDEPAIPRVKPTATRTLKIEWNDPNNPGMRYYRGGGYSAPLYSFSADGKFLATQEANTNQLVVWDIAAGKNEGGFGQSNQTMAIALSPDGKKLITTGSQNGRNCTVELWDTDKRKKIADLDEGVNFTAFGGAAFSPDGKTVALAGTPLRNGQAGGIMIHFWDVASGDEVRKINGPVAGPVQNRRMFRMASVDCMAFAGDGKMLALVSDRKIVLYEVSTGAERAVLATLPGGRAVQPNPYNNGGPDSVASAMAFSPDGRVLAAACTDGQIRLWDVVTGAELLPATGHKSDVRD
jgi:WD40 repeat protein